MPIVAKTPVVSTPDEIASRPRRLRHSPEVLLQRASERAAETEHADKALSSSKPSKPATNGKRRRGVAKKDENGKYLPCEAPVGFAKPPISGQFPKGNRGGGRPKGARSQDSIKREKLSQKESVTVNGKTRKVARRELAEEMLHKKAFENGGNAKLLTQISADAMRLFAETANDNGKSSLFGDPAMDQQIIQTFLAGLSIGEPSPDGFDPTALAGTPIADFTGSGQDDDGWDEGDWQETQASRENDNDGENGDD